ncbi:MAG: SH3 domain-containing protein, partial [Anaerolineales bacterium]|nr:SH3 domain-containing protein [Anaerolineales bacterium]
MNQLPRTINLMLVLMFMFAACNLPASAMPTPEGTATSTPGATETSTSTPSPTVIPSPTRTLITVRAKDHPVNCRFGPGLVFEIIGRVNPNQSTQAIGRTSDSLWLNVRDPGNPGGVCWVAASAVKTEGEAASLSVTVAQLVAVTNLAVRVEPVKITVACSAFPQVFGFVGEITTNGPAIVTWRWEINTGNGPDQTLTFESAGTKTVQEFYRVNGANDYKVKLHVFGP